MHDRTDEQYQKHEGVVCRPDSSNTPPIERSEMDRSSQFFFDCKQRCNQISTQQEEEAYRKLCTGSERVPQHHMACQVVRDRPRECVMKENAKKRKEAHCIQLWPIEHR